MDRIAEKLSRWFGSAPFILVHVVWFAGWLALGLEVEQLLLAVSLEAIFLTLFVLRGENVQSDRLLKLIERVDRQVKDAEEFSKKDLNASRRIEKKIKGKKDGRSKS